MNDSHLALFDGAGAVFVTEPESSQRISIEALSSLLPRGTSLFTLRCNFDEGGPWAGTRDFFRALLPSLESRAPDLIARHDYELVHVLPDLKPRLGVRNPSLTDLASNEERVRNYPADRAFRIVHGLIDLLIAFKERDENRKLDPWALLCLNYEAAGHMTRSFLQELMRRAATRLHLLLIPVCADGEPVFPDALPRRTLPFGIAEPEGFRATDQEDVAERARVIEASISDDTLVSTGSIPDLIRFWKAAGRADKVFEWRYKALHAFNTLGFYADALCYGEPAREVARRSGGLPLSVRWGIFFKLFMSYLGTNDVESARRIAEEDVLTDRGDPAEAPMRIRLCYLMAMLHARYLPVRDFATGEEYLERGLAYLQKAALPESEHYFQLVFNRNGLAMIRSFQGRHQEALALCQEGYELLAEHLGSGQHRLHKSVLLYNLAQVYAQTGSFDRAIEHYTAAMRMDPNYSEYFNERGNLLLKLGRLAEACRDYRHAIELGAPYFEVWSNLGQCYRLQGRMEEAIAAYDRSLDLQPDQPMVWVVRAQALEALGRLDEAIAAYGSALGLQPALWPASAGRAVLLYEQGRLDECLADLDRALALAPEEADIYQNRAVAYGDLGRRQEAARDLCRYLELRPDAADRSEVEARLRDLSSPLASAATPRTSATAGTCPPSC